MIPRWRLFFLLFVFVAGTALPSHAQRTAPRPEETFADAFRLYDQRLYPDASEAFTAFRASHPHSLLAPQSLYLGAKSALAQERDRETRHLLVQLQDTYPTHPQAQEARLGLAQYYLDEGRTKQARTQLESIADDPNSPSEGARAVYLLGRTEQQDGNLETALRHFTRVRTEFPNTDIAPTALYARGVTQVRLERFDRATASFEMLGEQYPNSPFAQNLGTILGEVYYRLGQFEDAAEELQKRLPELRGTDRARALFLLGESYTQMGRPDAAVTQYQTVLNEYADSPYATSARYGLAHQYYRAGRYEDAAQAFGQVRSADSPLAPPATYYAAASRTLLGDRSEALSLYRTFLEQQDNGRLATEAQFEVGLLLYQDEQYSEAAASFRTVLQTSPPPERRGRANYWLGNARLANGNLDAALKAYDRAIQLGAAPESVRIEVRFQNAWSQYQSERYESAASNFAALADEHPDADRGRAALFWSGDSYYQLGRYSQARSLFRQFLQTDPTGAKRAGAQYALAWTYFKQRAFEAAARYFQQFLDTYGGTDTNIPYRQDARLRLADSYFALKRYDAAISVYRQVGDPGTDYALYQTGKALYYSDQLDEALDTLRRFAQKYSESPWRPDALYRIADIHFQQQGYQAARDGFERLIEAYPEHDLTPQAQYAIGDAYYNQGQMDSAVEAYRRVLETYPNSPSASEAASSIFFALNAAGQLDRADALIDSIAASQPDANLRERLRFQRARVAFQSGQSARALKLFRDFVRTSSTESLVPPSYYYLGLLYADLDQYTEAKNYLSRLVEQYPESDNYPEGALRLGEIHLDQEEYTEAVTAFRAAAENEQTSDALRAQARYGESVALLRLGRTGEAEALLQKLLKTEKGSPVRQSARLGLGRIREQQNQPDDARELYRTVVESSESETGAEALFRLGHLLREQGSPRAAIRELERMPSLYAGYPEWEARGLLEQARAYRALGETGQAVQLYGEVVDNYPGTPFAETAQKEEKSISSSS